MKREIRFIPSPMRDGTESSLDLLFQVVGELGVVEFEVATNWYTDGVIDLRLKEMKDDVQSEKDDFILKHFWMGPRPLDVCYFSPVRISEDDSYWDEGNKFHAPQFVPCYYGYRYVNEGEKWTTDFLYEKLLRGGESAVFEFLESYYVEVFGELR